jgi:hypothetical protein
MVPGEREGVLEERPLLMAIVKARNCADELASLAEQLLVAIIPRASCRQSSGLRVVKRRLVFFGAAIKLARFTARNGC